MYDILRAGGRLDSEPFPESIDRRSFSTGDACLAILAKRRVDYVIVYGAYDRRYGTNEHALLRALAADNRCVRPTVSSAEYDVFVILRGCPVESSLIDAALRSR